MEGKGDDTKNDRSQNSKALFVNMFQQTIISKELNELFESNNVNIIWNRIKEHIREISFHLIGTHILSTLCLPQVIFFALFESRRGFSAPNPLAEL